MPENAPRLAGQGKLALPISARLLSWLRLPVCLRHFGPGLACLLLAACGTHVSPQGGATGELFARGVDQITDLYIEPISGQKLVFVGTKNLARLDPRLGVSVGTDVRDRNTLTLTYDGIVAGSYQVPPDIDGGSAGEIILQTIAAAKKASGRIRALPED